MKSTFDNLAEYKKQRVIDACVREFGEHGYASSSMDGIIKRAGISKGGLYGYVSSKRELFLFIVDYSYSRLYEYLRERIGREINGLQPDLLDRLRHVAERAIDFYIDHPDFIYLIVRTSHIPDEQLAAEVRGIFDKHFIGLFGDTDDSGLSYPRIKFLILQCGFCRKPASTSSMRLSARRIPQNKKRLHGKLGFLPQRNEERNLQPVKSNFRPSVYHLRLLSSGTLST